MIITAELSLYPLQSDYIEVIQAFIQKLNERDGLSVHTNAMSTQILGEAQTVFAAVQELLEQSAQRFGDQVLVCKFIPKPLDLGAG
ncbi:MAG: YkoF family thiamine/hydroxymethylpyrimidine-binding protein [Pseudomonadota bacterium]